MDLYLKVTLKTTSGLSNSVLIKRKVGDCLDNVHDDFSINSTLSQSLTSPKVYKTISSFYYAVIRGGCAAGASPTVDVFRDSTATDKVLSNLISSSTVEFNVSEANVVHQYYFKFKSGSITSKIFPVYYKVTETKKASPNCLEVVSGSSY